jgi:hypothetical protein
MPKDGWTTLSGFGKSICSKSWIKPLAVITDLIRDPEFIEVLDSRLRGNDKEKSKTTQGRKGDKS